MGLSIPVINGGVTGLWFWKSYGLGYADSFFVDVSWLMLGGISLWAAFVAKPMDKKTQEIDPSAEISDAISSKIQIEDSVLTTNLSKN